MGVSVRHNSKLAAVVALVAAVLTVAWFARALQTGSVADWAWCAVVATVGVLQLLVVRDSRAPLLVADEHGVRVRRGVTWSGLRWQDIEHVEVTSPRSWLRDGSIVVHPRAVEGPLEEGADESGESPSTLTAENFVVPLAFTTRLDFEELTGDLVADLDYLASGRVPVLVLTRLEPEKAEKPAKAEKPPKAEKPAKAEKPPKAEKPAKLTRKERAELKADAWAAQELEDATAAEPEDATKQGQLPDIESVPEPEFDPVEPVRS